MLWILHSVFGLVKLFLILFCSICKAVFVPRKSLIINVVQLFSHFKMNKWFTNNFMLVRLSFASAHSSRWAEPLFSKITEQSCKIVISNVLGQNFISKEMNQNQENISINTSEIPSGIYLVSVFNNSTSFTRRMIKL